jgi:hypothetical protein
LLSTNLVYNHYYFLPTLYLIIIIEALNAPGGTEGRRIFWDNQIALAHKLQLAILALAAHATTVLGPPFHHGRHGSITWATVRPGEIPFIA